MKHLIASYKLIQEKFDLTLLEAELKVLDKALESFEEAIQNLNSQTFELNNSEIDKFLEGILSLETGFIKSFKSLNEIEWKIKSFENELMRANDRNSSFNYSREAKDFENKNYSGSKIGRLTKSIKLIKERIKLAYELSNNFSKQIDALKHNKSKREIVANLIEEIKNYASKISEYKSIDYASKISMYKSIEVPPIEPVNPSAGPAEVIILILAASDLIIKKYLPGIKKFIKDN